MSLSRYYLNKVFDDFEDNLGFGGRARDSLFSRRPYLSSFYQPLSRSSLSSKVDSVDKGTTVDKDGFQVLLDVQHFSPDEISVKTVENAIVVEAKHEERKDEQGSISRQFKRRYLLPAGYNSYDVTSSISSDGILTIKAPSPNAGKTDGRERNVRIQKTGTAHSTYSKPTTTSSYTPSSRYTRSTAAPTESKYEAPPRESKYEWRSKVEPKSTETKSEAAPAESKPAEKQPDPTPEAKPEESKPSDSTDDEE